MQPCHKGAAQGAATAIPFSVRLSARFDFSSLGLVSDESNGAGRSRDRSHAVDSFRCFGPSCQSFARAPMPIPAATSPHFHDAAGIERCARPLQFLKPGICSCAQARADDADADIFETQERTFLTRYSDCKRKSLR